MDHEIIGKLQKVLAEPITDEMHVVYVVAEIRKLLEHEGGSRGHPELSFFGNWALHIRIDRQEPAARMLHELEAILENLEAPDFAARVSDVISLQRLRKELSRCADEWELPAHNFNDRDAWWRFSRLYAEVVREVPLASSGPLLQAEEFVITREGVSQVYGEGSPPENLCWQVRLKDERVIYGAFLYY